MAKQPIHQFWLVVQLLHYGNRSHSKKWWEPKLAHSPCLPYHKTTTTITAIISILVIPIKCWPNQWKSFLVFSSILLLLVFVVIIILVIRFLLGESITQFTIRKVNLNWRRRRRMKKNITMNMMSSRTTINVAKIQTEVCKLRKRSHWWWIRIVPHLNCHQLWWRWWWMI